MGIFHSRPDPVKPVATPVEPVATPVTTPVTTPVMTPVETSDSSANPMPILPENKINNLSIELPLVSFITNQPSESADQMRLEE